MTIETVLLAVNEEDDRRVERLADVALEVAEPLDATVVIAHVLPEEPEVVSTSTAPISGSPGPYVLSDDEYDDLLEEFPPEEYTVDEIVAEQGTVRAVADAVADAGVDHEVRGAVGDPSEGLVALADEFDADRIVVSGRSRSPTDKVIFGSVAQTVLLESPCPVTFVRND
ncbi:hypothetical protein GCM10027435_21040 [Haloparvum alkalitolerans]|uniref:universal stress protein n=1 Tax=Haloparvum alkalitolerans TaxID=1042953 RepID=UPI003CEDF329